MSTKQVDVQRFSITSSKSFPDVIEIFEVAVGHPDMSTFRENVVTAKTYTELEKVVHAGIGPSGLMEFIRFDLGEVLRKRNGADAPRSLRLILGNPLIMSQMVEYVPDAG